ncbi:MAG: hypothetical protein V4489_02185 [Chlamydiota bacterium]
MGQKIITSLSFKVLSTIQDVEIRLKKPVSKHVFGRLFTLLEDIQKECQDPDLQDKIISLYGKIIDRYVDTEIQKIAVLAEKPNQNLEILRKKIADVKLYGISKENFSILKKAEQKIQQNNEALCLTASQNSPVEIEWVEEVFTLASMIYHKENEKIKSTYQNLPKEVHQSLLNHLIFLETTLFQNDFLMMQALFATAHELAERPLIKYPTSQEIHHFFKEEKIIKKADHPQYWAYKIN